jgi:hypothetical protein
MTSLRPADVIFQRETPSAGPENYNFQGIMILGTKLPTPDEADMNS